VGRSLRLSTGAAIITRGLTVLSQNAEAQLHVGIGGGPGISVGVSGPGISGRRLDRASVSKEAGGVGLWWPEPGLRR